MTRELRGRIEHRDVAGFRQDDETYVRQPASPLVGEAPRDERIALAPDEQGGDADGRQVGADVMTDGVETTAEQARRAGAEAVAQGVSEERRRRVPNRREERQDVSGQAAPGRHAGGRDEHEPAHRFRSLCGQLRRDQAAKRMTRYVGAAESFAVEPVSQPARCVVRAEALHRSEARQVDDAYVAILEEREHRPPPATRP